MTDCRDNKIEIAGNGLVGMYQHLFRILQGVQGQRQLVVHFTLCLSSACTACISGELKAWGMNIESYRGDCDHCDVTGRDQWEQRCASLNIRACEYWTTMNQATLPLTERRDAWQGGHDKALI